MKLLKIIFIIQFFFSCYTPLGKVKRSKALSYNHNGELITRSEFEQMESWLAKIDKKIYDIDLNLTLMGFNIILLLLLYNYHDHYHEHTYYY